MFRPALLLNADYSPMKIVPWTRAVELILDGKAATVEPYEGAFVRSAHLAIPWPAAVALKRYRVVRSRIKFSARNVLLRDRFTCAYCGVRPTLPDGRPDRAALTLDHVIPRARGRDNHGAVYLPWSKTWVNVTCWENSVTACGGPGRCNARKGDRTPAQAGMTLLYLPRVPTQTDVLRMGLHRIKTVPSLWQPYLPADFLASATYAVEDAVVR
jgi:5-methylcytosine-specific restriction endonuclease McrA